MGLIAFFGDERFEVNPWRANPLNDFKRKSAGRYNSLDRIGKKPFTDYTGPGLDTVEFTITADASLGVEPRDELDRWNAIVNAGYADILVVGNELVGENLWLLKSATETWARIDGNGRVIRATIELSFEEYVES